MVLASRSTGDGRRSISRRLAAGSVAAVLAVTALTVAVTGSPAQAAAPTGSLDLTDLDGVAHGWAYDSDVPAQVIDVHFYLNGPAGGGGTFIGRVWADRSRPDLNAAGYPGNHGFQFRVPDEYRDGSPHPLYAYAIDPAGGFAVVPLSPRTVRLTPPGTVPAPNGPVGAGAEQKVFTYTTQRCDNDDIPDGPARAFRGGGRVNLVATHWTSRRSTGYSLDQTQRQCAPVMSSRREANPNTYQHYEWLWSPYTTDGNTVHALVHNEYQGNNDPNTANCPSRVYNNCWYSAITSATSTNGGATFTHVNGPAHVVVRPSAAYRPDGGPQGVIEPTNVVRNPGNGLFYALYQARAIAPQPGGVCVMRTGTLADPRSWRAWNGSSFGADTSAGAVCTPVEPMLHGSVTWNTHYQKFLLIGITQESATPTYSISYRLSDDLVTWGPLKKVMDVNAFGSTNPGLPQRLYPSLLDPQSGALSFDTTGRYPFLYVTHFNGGTMATLNRDLVRIPLVLP